MNPIAAILPIAATAPTPAISNVRDQSFTSQNGWDETFQAQQEPEEVELPAPLKDQPNPLVEPPPEFTVETLQVDQEALLDLDVPVTEQQRNEYNQELLTAYIEVDEVQLTTPHLLPAIEV